MNSRIEKGRAVLSLLPPQLRRQWEATMLRHWTDVLADGKPANDYPTERKWLKAVGEGKREADPEALGTDHLALVAYRFGRAAGLLTKAGVVRGRVEVVDPQLVFLSPAKYTTTFLRPGQVPPDRFESERYGGRASGAVFIKATVSRRGGRVYVYPKFVSHPFYQYSRTEL